MLSCRASEFGHFGHFKAHLSFDDFTQGYVRRTEIFSVHHEWPAPAAAAGV